MHLEIIPCTNPASISLKKVYHYTMNSASSSVILEFLSLIPHPLALRMSVLIKLSPKRLVLKPRLQNGVAESALPKSHETQDRNAG